MSAKGGGGGGGGGVIFLADVRIEWDLKISLALSTTILNMCNKALAR